MNRVTQAQTVTVEREIDASPDELFDAWLDPESLAIWMRPGDTSKAAARVDPKVAGQFEIVMTGPYGSHVHRGKYLLIDRPKVLSFTWISEATGLLQTLVTVEFRAKGKRTLVVLTHEKLPEEAALRSHKKGWNAIFDLLEATVGAARKV
jgi:uncharacterized protein YndB with AHSA1/START domain